MFSKALRSLKVHQTKAAEPTTQQVHAEEEAEREDAKPEQSESNEKEQEDSNDGEPQDREAHETTQEANDQDAEQDESEQQQAENEEANDNVEEPEAGQAGAVEEPEGDEQGHDENGGEEQQQEVKGELEEEQEEAGEEQQEEAEEEEDAGSNTAGRTAKVAVTNQRAAKFRKRIERPIDKDGNRVTQQKTIAYAWPNGPRIDMEHFHYVQNDFQRREGAVAAVRERIHNKSRPGYEIRPQRKWTPKLIAQMVVGRYLSWLPCVRIDLADAVWDGDIILVHTIIMEHPEEGVDARDKNGQTILNISIQRQHEPVIRMLMERGADVDLPDEETLFTPLISAIIMGNKALCRRLLRKGADLNVPDNEGLTPLLWASIRGYLEIAAQLIKGGARVNHQDNDGWTALHIVCFKGYVELVDYLLESAKARYDLEDVYGFNALMYARIAGNDDVVKRIDEHHAALLKKQAKLQAKAASDKR